MVYALVLFCLLISVYAITLHLKNVKLKHSLENLQSDYDILKQNYDLVRTSNDELKQDYGKLSDKNTVDIQRALTQFRDFEINVRESMKWFTLNRNINASSRYTDIKGQLNTCMTLDNNTCEIALDCIHNINEDNKMEYKTDDASVARDDFLKSLALIYDQKGGDCEDISLLFTAEYNYLVDQCTAAGVKRKKVNVVTNDQDLKGNYMYVVCGGFDPQEVVSGYGGHCVVALTKMPILLTSDVYPYLKEAALVEPQNGEFMFYMDDTEATELFDDGQPAETLFHINTVITNNDLKVFYNWGEEVGWLGFSEFLERIEKLKGDIK